jgi:hypothetical protein
LRVAPHDFQQVVNAMGKAESHAKWLEERAYQLWEAEGRPEGRALDHWLLAEADLHKKERLQSAQAAPSTKAQFAAKKTNPPSGRRSNR